MKQPFLGGARSALYLIGLLVATGVVAFSCKFVQPSDQVLFDCDSSGGCTEGFACGYDRICRPIANDCRSTCDGGCCVDNECMTFDRQDQNACGYSGAACTQCPGAASCRRGVCINSSCDSYWDQCYLPGANPDGGCVQGLTDARCGAYGVICKACEPGQRCYIGACIWPGTGQLGDPCSGPSNCGIQSGIYLDCYGAAPFPGGYCARWCDLNYSSDCDGVCVPIAEDPTQGGICYGGCRTDGDCRDGYSCQRLSTGNACVGRCVTDAQCRSIDGNRTGYCGSDGHCCGGTGFPCCPGTDGLPQCLGRGLGGGPSQCDPTGFCN